MNTCIRPFLLPMDLWMPCDQVGDPYSSCHDGGAREMDGQLGALVAFAEEPGLVPSTHMPAHVCLSLLNNRNSVVS